MTLFTCETASQFDLVISVFAGQADRCQTLTCVTVATTHCLGTTQWFKERVTWICNPDSTYYILVQARSAGVLGSFDLRLNKGPSNNICQGAVELTPFFSQSGTLRGATTVEQNWAIGDGSLCFDIPTSIEPDSILSQSPCPPKGKQDI